MIGATLAIKRAHRFFILGLWVAMLGRFAKTWKIEDAIKIDLQRGIDLPPAARSDMSGTNDINIDSLAVGPVS